MSFQMRSMSSRPSRVTKETTSFWRSFTLVTRKNSSVPKNTTNWLIAGVITPSAVPRNSVGLVSTEIGVVPVTLAIAPLISCSTDSG